MWRRPAPKAARTASSRERPEARAIIRLATLAQAMRRTRATAPMMTTRVGRTRPTRVSRRGRATNVLCPLLSGKALASWAASDERSAFAASSETPGRAWPRPGSCGPSGSDWSARGRPPPTPRSAVGKAHGRGHHAHDLVGRGSDPHRAAHRLRRASEMPLRETRAHDGRTQGVVAVEESPRRRGHAEDAEEVRMDALSCDQLGLVAHPHAHVAALVIGDGLERLAAGATSIRSPPARLACVPAGVRPAVLYGHDAVGIRIGQRPQDHTVDHAEDGGVGADADAPGSGRWRP